MMKWRKIGQIFAPKALVPWMHSHAAVPIVDYVEKDLLKIYYSTRDSLNRSHTAYIIVNINKPTKVVGFSRYPVLKPGNLGAFDDSGAMGSCIVDVNGEKYLYYVGWNLGVTVPFRNSIGLAISKDGGRTFIKFSEGPIIERNYREPHFAASSCVIRESGIFRGYYQSCVGWALVQGMPRHQYHIKYAESNNGIDWMRTGKVAIDFKDGGEYALSVPRVIKDPNIYRMWYSYRGESYRIGYAESHDGIQWTRRDEEAGIEVSDGGWDSEMICYPCVFDHEGQRYMLYNGNGYGKTGIGLAVLEQK
jgi:hypothetical protein